MQQAEKHRCDNKLSSVVVAAAQRSGTALIVELHALVAAALENDLAVQQGHHEVVARGNDVGDAAVDDGPATPSGAQQQPPGEHMAVGDVDLALLHLHEDRTDSPPGPHLHAVGAALIHIAAVTKHHARLRSTSVRGAAWWTQMKAGTNADLLGFGQAEQRRPEGHPVRVHGAPCGASRVMANDVSVAAIEEKVDTTAWRTIVVRGPGDTLGHYSLHVCRDVGSAKGACEVEVHEGINVQRQVVLQRIRHVHGLPNGGGEVVLRIVTAQPVLVLRQGLVQEDAPLPRTVARLRSTDG